MIKPNAASIRISFNYNSNVNVNSCAKCIFRGNKENVLTGMEEACLARDRERKRLARDRERKRRKVVEETHLEVEEEARRAHTRNKYLLRKS